MLSPAKAALDASGLPRLQEMDDATAPTLQEKFTRFNAALRRVGLTSATSRFAAGTDSPIPTP